MYQPKPGDFGLTKIEGPMGWLVKLGQLLNGDASEFTHAFVVLEDGMLIEAEPGGAKIQPLSKYDGREVAYSRIPLTDEQRMHIVGEAVSRLATPYSFVDYLALALARLGIRPKWLRNYVASSGHMICSQLVDFAYCRSGVHLFDDGRLSQDVTPGDLANRLLVADFTAVAGSTPAPGS